VIGDVIMTSHLSG